MQRRAIAPPFDIKALLAYVEMLRAADVELTISIPCGGGWSTRNLPDGAALALYLTDREAFYANAWKITREQFRGWYGDGSQPGTLVCAATARTGNRCTNVVRHGFGLGPREWAERQGELCTAHAKQLAKKS